MTGLHCGDTKIPGLLCPFANGYTQKDIHHTSCQSSHHPRMASAFDAHYHHHISPRRTCTKSACFGSILAESSYTALSIHCVPHRFSHTPSSSSLPTSTIRPSLVTASQAIASIVVFPPRPSAGERTRWRRMSSCPPCGRRNSHCLSWRRPWKRTVGSSHGGTTVSPSDGVVMSKVDCFVVEVSRAGASMSIATSTRSHSAAMSQFWPSRHQSSSDRSSFVSSLAS
jgi:hypothetical protein